MKTRATLMIVTSILVLLPGCRFRERQAALQSRLAVHRASSVKPVVLSMPLPLSVVPRPDLVLASLNKRVLGRENSQRDIYRVMHDVDPVVTLAAQQPSVQPALQRLAACQGVSLEKMRANWILMQDADIMLESGGDPDAVSSAGAVGVAQWMPSTGAKVGLKVDIAAAALLTPSITELQRQLAWIQYIRTPNHNPAAPGIPVVSAPEVEPKFKLLCREIDDLRNKRATLDERYDLKKSVFAQTRYLLGISGTFPSPSWLFQAYHGGEGGVTRTLRDYCGADWPGSPTAAILHGDGQSGDGHGITFETVYFGSTPRSHQAAFKYLYSRGDDHRHYWWKLRVAQEALDLYNRNTAESARVSRALFPGSPAPMVWYGKDHPMLLSLDDVIVATGTHELVQVSPADDVLPIKTLDDQSHAEAYQVLRPVAWGALDMIRLAYKKCGGTSRLQLPELTRSVELNGLRDKRLTESTPIAPTFQPGKPLWPPKPNPVQDEFDYHTAGLEFDIERPANLDDRMILDYCIGYLEDRGIVLRLQPKGENVWQIVPNPRFSKSLSSIAQTGRVPELCGL